MKKQKKIQIALVFMFVILFCAKQVRADEIRVAMASNFSVAGKDIADRFRTKTGHKVVLIFGSTGKHYAQIKNGAPFEVFFAADAKHPKLLENEKFSQFGSRFTYAVGKVVLWSPNPDMVDNAGDVLKIGNFRYLAIANPKLAPYGKAANQILKNFSVQTKLQGSIVRGENISQTFRFVNSGNAELGFVAYSQIKHLGKPIKGSFWIPSQALYSPIEQQATLLKDNNLARQFLNFVKSESVRKIIRNYGYGTP